MKNYSYLLFVFFTLVFHSCKKDISKESITLNEKITFPTTEADKKNVRIAKEVSQVLKEVYKNHQAFYEVNATIYSGYYEDERVLLKDLLFPETSQLYQQESFKRYNATIGVFKTNFYNVISEGEYPEIKTLLSFNDYSTANLPSASPVDTAAEIFANFSGVSIYFPYSENFQVPLTTQYFSNINTDPWGYLATVIPADREANSAPGEQPMKNRRFVNGDYEWYIDYTPITVDDNYAENNITHIVGFGVVPRITSDPPPPATNVNRVYVGWARINDKQYDNFISFNSANGGGSEIKLCRISGYLQLQNQQITNFVGDIGEVHYTLKQINKGIWKRVYWVWDADWVPNNLEQAMAVYEEDREDEKTYSGGLTTTVRDIFDSTTNITGQVSYSIKIKSQDEIILHRKITRNSYFEQQKLTRVGVLICVTKKAELVDTTIHFFQVGIGRLMMATEQVEQVGIILGLITLTNLNFCHRLHL